MIKILKTWLARPSFVFFAALFGVMLASPSLWSGWELDDEIHRYWILGDDEIPHPKPIDMFAFIDGDQETFRIKHDAGIYPWWSLPNLKIAFCRPISALTHIIDYRFWPDSALMMHAHSLLWLAACVVAVGALFRRLMGATWIAGLATLFYAIDDARANPAGWIANRNALPAALFGILAILAHDRWRRSGWRLGVIFAPLALLASVLSNEAGIATTAYLFAHAVFLDTGSFRRRMLGLVPYVVIVIAWRILYAWMGYGIFGSGFYIDPLAEPLAFFFSLVLKAPIMLLGQWAIPPSDAFVVLSSMGLIWWFWAWACVSLAIISIWIVPIIRTDRVAKFWACGMIFSVVPTCATLPMDRLLMFVGLGGFGLLAIFMAKVFGPQDTAQQGRALRRMRVALAVFFCVVHGLLAPAAFAFRAKHLVDPAFGNQIFLKTELDDALAQQTLIVVNAPSVFHATYTPIQWALAGKPVPKLMRFLGPSTSAITITRLNERTVILDAETGYLTDLMDQLFRARRHGFSQGDRIELPGQTIEILSLTTDGRPKEVSFRFDVPLEDESLRWLKWVDGTYMPFTPPAIGQRIELPRAWPKF